jgi:hypothetical protein
MRRYIFTKLERKRLQGWLAGEVSADSAVMNMTLDRVRMYKKGLLACVKGDIKQQTVGAIVNPANSLMIVEGLREL